MPARPPNSKKKETKTTTPRPNTGKEGAVYLTSGGTPYREPEINAKKLKHYSKNFYGAGITKKLLALFFGDSFEIEVKNQAGEQNENLEKEIMNMVTAREVSLFSKMKIGWTDRLWLCMGAFNPIWEQDGTTWTLKSLRRLPPESFAPQAQTISLNGAGLNEIVYGTILKGVVAMPDDSIKYFQTGANGQQSEIKQIYTVKDSTATTPDGEPEILPVSPVITMLDFAWSAQMQKLNRLGAPILLLRITNATPDDIKYGEKLVKNWGKDTAFLLRKNMEIVEFNPHDTETALETINKLTEMCLDYWVPTSFLSQNGQLIGGNSNSDVTLLYSYIAGVHREIEAQWEPLLQIYLDANGYEGYRIKIKIPDPELDDTAIKLEQAKVGADTGLLTENEVRTRLGAEEMTPEELEELPARKKEAQAQEAARMQAEALKAQAKGQPPEGQGSPQAGPRQGKQGEPQGNPRTPQGAAGKKPPEKDLKQFKQSRPYFWPDEAQEEHNHGHEADPDPTLSKIIDEEERELNLALEALSRAVLAKL